jgi:ubiquinone/menaquinone biosynthesis C-methylase UbiE
VSVDDHRARRAVSFSSVADAYERARPQYPEEAAVWLAGDPSREVVDLAAGTGKLTRVLVRVGHRVTAVEPLPEMLERLVEAVPGVAGALEGRAEAIPLPDESADAVVVAQAFHWFDQPVALREIARVLRPGGMLGLVWNIRDDGTEWVARLTELIGSEGDSDDDEAAVIRASGLYGPVEESEWRWEQPLDRTRLLDLVLSRSYCATLPPDERQTVLDAVGRLYDETVAAAGGGELAMPYVTYGFRAERR